MPGKNISSRIKNVEQYEALLDKGFSKEKAARIANAEKSGKKEGQPLKYENRPKEELYEQAKKIEIKGRSKMSKKDLIHALRNSK